MGASSFKRDLFPSLLIVALLSCCATLVLSSCSNKTSAAIIGKWQVQGSKEMVEFRKDGTVITSQDTTAGPPGDTRSIEQETTGKYTFTDGSHMNLQINTGNTNQRAMSISCEVHIHGNKMDMTMKAPGERQQHKAIFKRLE
jgi:hypothetical protein